MSHKNYEQNLEGARACCTPPGSATANGNFALLMPRSHLHVKTSRKIYVRAIFPNGVGRGYIVAVTGSTCNCGGNRCMAVTRDVGGSLFGAYREVVTYTP